MKYVLFYESAYDVLSKAPPHLPAHGARIDEFARRGVLEMVGTFADPQKDRSMSIFTTREAAEEFVAGDPFIIKRRDTGLGDPRVERDAHRPGVSHRSRI